MDTNLTARPLAKDIDGLTGRLREVVQHLFRGSAWGLWIGSAVLAGGAAAGR